MRKIDREKGYYFRFYLFLLLLNIIWVEVDYKCMIYKRYCISFLVYIIRFLVLILLEFLLFVILFFILEW